jgi:exopolyphosphatase/guanosine-5'-triphosphate,3'-diphosphate pyrophosphatase
MSTKARAKIPGLSVERADIIVAGIAIIDCVMKRLGVNTLRVHDRGIRDGLILNMIEQEFPKLAVKAAPHNRISTARKFAHTCNYERPHSEHVAKLALQIFDQLAEVAPQMGLWTVTHREVLEAASILHDIGYYINYAKHHKHSHHLIIHSELSGFTYRELNVIGNIARYHRRAEPKKSHPAFAALPPSDRQMVEALAAILRVADGLDRTHSQVVKSVTLQLRKDQIAFCARADAEPTVDIWGASRKCRLFKRVFERTPVFEWVPADSELGATHAKAIKPLSLAS